jgi:3-oxoacyl-[acyl-carrier-protein] synthase III
MNREVFVDHIGYALGEVTRTVEEAGSRGDLLSQPEVLREAGFCVHHVGGLRQTAYDLARQAVQTIEHALGNVGAIIYSTCIPANANIGNGEAYLESRDVKNLMDFPASHLQSDFDLDRAIVIGLSQQACTGLLGSLRLAQALLRSEPEMERILCLTSDRFPEGALYEQSYNLISDGAAACVVSLSPASFRLLAVHGITNGALAQANDEETAGTFFVYTHRVIQETLAKAGLHISDVAWFVAQNMNRKASDILARLLKFDPGRVVSPTLAEVAHVISGDNLINLKYLIEHGHIQCGERVLLCMAGYGLNWQCVILEKS